jgi:putative addiction module killer protein
MAEAIPHSAREYLDLGGRSPFADWFNLLSVEAAAKVTAAITRMDQGNFSNAKPVGEGVSESRIDFGPGYRIYFGKERGRILILLGGGTKKRQQQNIARAKTNWQDYKRRIQR